MLSSRVDDGIIGYKAQGAFGGIPHEALSSHPPKGGGFSRADSIT